MMRTTRVTITVLFVVALAILNLSCGKKEEARPPVTTKVQDGVTTFEKVYNQESGSITGCLLLLTPDGGYLVSGKLETKNNKESAYLLKLDVNGNKMWDRWYTQATPLKAQRVAICDEGGYLIACQAERTEDSDKKKIVLIKVDSEGNYEWENTLQNDGDELCAGFEKTPDGNYIMVGRTVSSDGVRVDGFLTKINNRGILLYKKTFHDLGARDTFGPLVLGDSGFIMTATINVNEPVANTDVLVIRTDRDGKVLWHRQIGDSGHDGAFALAAAADGGFYLAGSTTSNSAGDYDVFVVKLDQDGDVEWKKPVGGTSHDAGYSIVSAVDGGCVVSGVSRSMGEGILKAYMLKLDKDGTLLWQKGFHAGDSQIGYSIAATPDGGFAITSAARRPHSPVFLTFVIKTDANGNVENSSANRPAVF